MARKKIEINENDGAGEFWIARILHVRRTYTRFVFCLGGSATFIRALIEAGYRVTLIDRDIAVMLEMKQCLREWGIDETSAPINFLCADLERGIGIIFHPADVLLVIRCLHHVNDITGALHMLARCAQEDILLAILDTTKELFEQEIALLRLYGGYGGSAHEACDRLCLQGCVDCGLLDEAAVTALFDNNGLDEANDFYYPVPCPCGRWDCGSFMWNWLGVWGFVPEE